MRIGFDAKRAFNNKTGLGNYSRFILNGLLNKLSKDDIYAFTPKVNAECYSEFPESQIVLPCKKNILWRSFGIVKELKNKNIDIYHGLSNEIPFGLKKNGIKSVITIHDLIFINFPQFYSIFDRTIYKFKLKYALNNADKIVAISKKTKDDILLFKPKIDPSKIQIVYQDCDQRFKKKYSFDEIENVKIKFGLNIPYIVSVGTIEERKNQMLLVKAFEALNNKNVQLILVGRGKKYKIKILDYLKNNHLENVKILSEVDNFDLPKLYAGSMFSAYISQVEGFGIPSIEALSCGVAVLTSKGTCLEEAAGEGGLFVDTSSLSAIKNGLETLINDQNLRQSLVEKGQKHIQQFHQELIAQQLIELYKSI